MGPIVFGIAIASGNILYSSGSITNTQVEKGLWVLIFVGPAIALLGLTLFGLDALSSKPMPRLNWLPFVTGIWYPVAYSFLAGYLFTHDGKFPQEYYLVIQILFLIQFLALCAFGAVLLNDTTQEMVTT
jgi:CDP-diglyceride synthetase